MKTGSELLVVGAGGMLGTALARVAIDRGCSLKALKETQLDITDCDSTRREIAEFARLVTRSGGKGAVVNAAAYTDVESAEDHADAAFLVNERAVGWLASACCGVGLDFVHVSTDFVFDGSKTSAYAEQDAPHPINVYGASKLAGEEAAVAGHPRVLIVRTAWTYGSGGNNFPAKIFEKAKKLLAIGGRHPDSGLSVVADQVGCPTYSVDLAGGLLDLLFAGATGIYHLAGGGWCSRYELALETLHLAGVAVPEDIEVTPVISMDVPSRAKRPLNSVLDCSKAATVGVRLPAWQDGLARYMRELQ